ncbi:hypothetical protein [Mucisphaera calidilacus]|uniref:PEP-CTERM protein-sorting domain-containing protein n=1 Tax=Mucisphaera calidilacus TaxID=2527982 RepID=A0A518BUF9_9BACT|nr:hypothetical protein [Mucisphaera calidilacus]QDU70633.1 hypothetical protein Pan265_04610 [Mucisphaera calidilacus]
MIRLTQCALVGCFAASASLGATMEVSLISGSEYAGLVTGDGQPSVTLTPDPSVKVVVEALGNALNVGGTVDLTNNGGGGNNGAGINSTGPNVGGDDGGAIDQINTGNGQVYDEAIAFSFFDSAMNPIDVTLTSTAVTLLGDGESIDVSIGAASLVIPGGGNGKIEYSFNANTVLAAGEKLIMAAGPETKYRPRFVTFEAAPVPTPSSLAAGLALLGLCGMRRR